MYSHIKPSTRYNQVEGLYERFMDEDKIMFVPITQINKRQGGLPYERYKNYMNATTMKEAIGLGATAEDLVLNYTADYMIFINEDEVVKNRYVKSPPRPRKRLNGVSKVPANNEIIIDTKEPYEPTVMKVVEKVGETKKEKNVDYYESWKSQEELAKSRLKTIKELEMRLKNQETSRDQLINENITLKMRLKNQQDISDVDVPECLEEMIKSGVWKKEITEGYNNLVMRLKNQQKENKFLKKEVEKVNAVKISNKKLEEKIIVLQKVAQVKDTKQLKLDYDKLKSDHHDCVSHWEEDIKEKDTYKSQISLFENLLEQEKTKNKKLEVRNEKVISEAERVIDLYKDKVKKLKEKLQKKVSKQSEVCNCESDQADIIQGLTMKISRLEKKIKNK